MCDKIHYVHLVEITCEHEDTLVHTMAFVTSHDPAVPTLTEVTNQLDPAEAAMLLGATHVTGPVAVIR